MLRSPQRHINRHNYRAIRNIFGQHIKRRIRRVKHRLAVKKCCSRRLYHNALLAKLKLIYIAVIGNINALQYINGVRINGNTSR